MRFIWANKKTKIWFIVMSILLVLTITITTILLKVPIVTNSLSLVFGGERANVVEDNRAEWYDRKYSSKEEVLEAANNFVVEVEKEGIVLLKNENDLLPLSTDAANVSVFGKNSANLVYSGSGSAGGGSSQAAQKTLYESLDAAGISYNKTLKSFYEDSGKSGSGRPANPAMTSGQRLSGFATGETPIDSYTSDVTDSYADYQDAAIVVISRIGGEGFDLPRTMAGSFDVATQENSSANSHYLELDENEKALLNHVKENFSNVIVVLNAGTTMEISELKADKEIDSILWIGFPGSTGIMALGQILTGLDTEGNQISPSGHTVDTWAADFTKDPTWYNTGIYGSEFGNRYLYNGEKTDYAFVNYEEGIDK